MPGSAGARGRGHDVLQRASPGARAGPADEGLQIAADRAASRVGASRTSRDAETRRPWLRAGGSWPGPGPARLEGRWRTRPAARRCGWAARTAGTRGARGASGTAAGPGPSRHPDIAPTVPGPTGHQVTPGQHTDPVAYSSDREQLVRSIEHAVRRIVNTRSGDREHASGRGRRRTGGRAGARHTTSGEAAPSGARAGRSAPCGRCPADAPDVPHVGREEAQLCLGILIGAVPAQEGVHGQSCGVRHGFAGAVHRAGGSGPP
jgi:hypothetical protein